MTTKSNLGLAVITAAVVLGAVSIAYFQLTGIQATMDSGSSCLEAAEYHLQLAVGNSTGAGEHFRTGQAYIMLSNMKADCRDWRA